MIVLQRALLGVGVFVLAAVFFIAGIWVAKKGGEEPVLAPPDEAAVAGQAAARELVEMALASRFAGHHREALAHLEEARRQGAALRGLDYQMALTHLDLGEYDQAVENARRSLRRGEETGNAHALLAMIALARARADGTPEAARKQVMRSVQEARETDPLNPAPHYVLAEFYRATGRPDLAVPSYRMALDRVSKSDGTLISTVKAGLAGLRKSHNASARPLEPDMVDGEAPPEQFFFAAADALLRNDRERAAAHLAWVRQRVPADIFKALMEDSFFQDYLVPGVVPGETPKSPE